MAKANIANTLVVPTESTVFPYYDDFSEEKNFYRILFRPGYAVQARELTQLQTILQNQIERFGRHIFQNGSSVIGGEVFFAPNIYDTLNVNPTFANSSVDITKFDKQLIVSTDTANTIQFRVIKSEPGTKDIPPVLYGNYISNERFTDNQTFVVKGKDTFANTANIYSYSASRFAGIKDSIFFYNGYFVKVPAQTVIIGKHSGYASCRVGLELQDAVVTEQSDSSLLDPAQESFNYQAPGAARYKVDLVLSTRALDSTDDEKFIELAKINNNNLESLVKYPTYSEIEEVLARRTYDESGNYTVKPFAISFDESVNSLKDSVKAVLSPGKAYVYGYEIETIYKTELNVRKGRDLANTNGFDLNMNYGNYVYVDTLRGVFDTSLMENFDIHCVPWNQIDYASASTYARTKIGNGRIKDLEFFSGDIDVDARKYEFYLFDTNFTGITSNVSYSDNNTIIRFYDNSSLLTNVSNAYSGAVLRVTEGTGAGYTYTINSYDATTGNIELTTNLFEPVSNASKVAIEFSFSSADSFVKSVPYTLGATSDAYANISTISKERTVPEGLAFISESNLGTLLFPLPEKYIAYGVDGPDKMAYSYRKKYATNFTAGVSEPISVLINENFIGATSSSNISSTVMNNFLVVCTNPQTSARSNGDIIKVTVDIQGSPEQATFNTGNTDINDTFSAVVFAKVELGDQNGYAVPKQKLLKKPNVVNISTDTPVTFINDKTGSSASVYLNDGQVVITDPSRKIGVLESLYIADVHKVYIYDLQGDEFIPGTPLAKYVDVSDRYELNTGQRDNFYDHAYIKLKANYAPCAGPLVVCCQYYEHTSIVAGGGGYFSVDSYPDLNADVYDAKGNYLGDGYSIIPQYVRSNGEVIELRDCIDFRPSRENASNASPNYTLSGIKIPLPTTDFTLDYSYYLGRRDLIVLDKTRKFNVIEGISSKYPQNPSAPTTGMVLYALDVPPYTETPSSVIARYIENKRYTMRDIGKIDKRVENLEYYVSLSTLEKNALDISIPDVDGLNRTKYGVFVDNFTSHILGNKDLIDYACAINFKDGWLQNRAETLGVDLKLSRVDSSDITITRDKVLLPYEEQRYLVQSAATKFSPVAEFLYAVFEGNIIMLPEADIWYSTQKSPDVVVTDKNIDRLTLDQIYQSVVNSQKR